MTSNLCQCSRFWPGTGKHAHPTLNAASRSGNPRKTGLRRMVRIARSRGHMRIDPSRTTMLRRAFEQDLKRRAKDLAQTVKEALVVLDVLGHDRMSTFTFNASLGAGLDMQAFRFLTDAQKLTAWRRWFAEQVRKGFLQVDVKGRPWTAKYVESAYKKGQLRSWMDAHKADLLNKADFYRGTKEQFIRSAFDAPERVSKMELLFTRSYDDLAGFTSEMAKATSRVLADGMAHGKNPRDIARQMSQDIEGLTYRRALTIARTEVIHAHAEGQLDSMEDLGIEEVGVDVEWRTAEDDRVCTLCQELLGVVMTIEEARGLLPRHPNCRCAFAPALRDFPQPGQIWGEAKKHIKASIRAEAPGESFKEARRRSVWAGKEVV